MNKIRKICKIIVQFCKRIIHWIISNRYILLYICIIAILSTYIIHNWNKCISMRFFEQFDGNNILFLVWIALIILFFYDIEAKGWKIHMKGYNETKKNIEKAESNYEIEKQINQVNSNLESLKAKMQEKGELSDECSEQTTNY